MTVVNAPSLAQSFDTLRSKLNDPDFLACRGLGNEVPFHVLPYDAALEDEARALTAQLIEEAHSGALAARVAHVDLWETICDLLASRNLLEKLPALEQRRGTDSLLARLQTIVSPAELVAHIRTRIADQAGELEPGRDALLITGVGKAYPIVRAHQILECAQPVFASIPLVLLYPGVYDGQSLRLFGSINDGNYYRAFNLL